LGAALRAMAGGADSGRRVTREPVAAQVIPQPQRNVGFSSVARIAFTHSSAFNGPVTRSRSLPPTSPELACGRWRESARAGARAREQATPSLRPAAQCSSSAVLCGLRRLCSLGKGLEDLGVEVEPCRPFLCWVFNGHAAPQTRAKIFGRKVVDGSGLRKVVGILCRLEVVLQQFRPGEQSRQQDSIKLKKERIGSEQADFLAVIFSAMLLVTAGDSLRDSCRIL
jgi:hypothetical protein